MYYVASISIIAHKEWPATATRGLAQGVQTQDGISVAVRQQDSLKGNPKKCMADVYMR